MKQNKVIAFTIADKANLKYLKMMKKSLRKFHSEEELPLQEITGKLLKDTLAKDPAFFYRATPVLASNFKDYDVVIKIDADSIITAPINEAWEGDFDVRVVLNSNPREFKRYPVTLLDIDPVQEYLNCGFVVMKSKEFIDHWHKICYSKHFNTYQYREQDLLNILIHYGNYKAELLENSDGLWGLSSKGYEPDVILKNKKLILPGNKEWNKEDKEIKIIHFAGGNDPNKGNYRIKYQPEVVRFLDRLVK